MKGFCLFATKGLAAFACFSANVMADLRPCSPEHGPLIIARELPPEERHIGHPLEILINDEAGLKQVTLVESNRNRSFVKVVDGRSEMFLYLNYKIDETSTDYIVVQAVNKKGATGCRAFSVITYTAER